MTARLSCPLGKCQTSIAYAQGLFEKWAIIQLDISGNGLELGCGCAPLKALTAQMPLSIIKSVPEGIRDLTLTPALHETNTNNSPSIQADKSPITPLQTTPISGNHRKTTMTSSTIAKSSTIPEKLQPSLVDLVPGGGG